MYASSRLAAALTAVMLLVPQAPAQQVKAGNVVFENLSNVPMRIELEYYVDAAGNSVSLPSRYWMVAPGQKYRLAVADNNGVLNDIVAKEFYFLLLTGDGQSRWNFKGGANVSGESLISMNFTALAEHRKIVAENRRQRLPSPGVLEVLVPDGAVVSCGNWKALVAGGTALLPSLKQLNPGENETCSVQIEFQAGGKVFREQASFVLHHDAPLTWDCRDIAAPDNLHRNARYLAACVREVLRAYESIGVKPAPAVEAQALEKVAHATEGLPTIGVDAIAQQTRASLSQAIKKIALDVRTGKAGTAQLKEMQAQLIVHGEKLYKDLRTRYGDGFRPAFDAYVQGAKVESALLPPKNNDHNVKGTRRQELDAQIGQLVPKIENAERQIQEWRNQAFVLKVALDAAKKAEIGEMDQTKKAFLAFTIAAGQRALDELYSRIDRTQTDLPFLRKHLDSLRQERLSLGS